MEAAIRPDDGEVRRRPYRHPFSDHPGDQAPPCDTLFIANPPVETSLDHFLAQLTKQRGYRRSKLWSSANHGINYLAQFNDHHDATCALFELYGQTYPASREGPLRCAFAQRPLDERLPAESSCRPTAARDPAVPSASAPPPTASRPAHHDTDDRPPNNSVLLRFPHYPGSKDQVRAMASALPGVVRVSFPTFSFDKGYGGMSVCYLNCESIPAAADALEHFDGTVLDGSPQPVEARFSRESSDVPDKIESRPPSAMLHVRFQPNDPSLQMDIKALFECDAGFVSLKFITPWSWNPRSTGSGLIRYDTIEAASRARAESDGRNLRPYGKPLWVQFARGDEESAEYDGHERTDASSRSSTTGSVIEEESPPTPMGRGTNVASDVTTDRSTGHGALGDEAEDIDVNFASLWVSNLSPEATREDVNAIFGAQPGVTDVRYLRVHGPRPHCMCFVDFEDSLSASNAIKKLWGYPLRGQRMKPKFNERQLPSTGLRSSSRTEYPARTSHLYTHNQIPGPDMRVCEQPLGSCAVIVSSLHKRATEYQLRHLFSQFRGFEDAKLVGDYYARRALLFFNDRQAAMQAIQRMDGKKVDYKAPFGMHMTLAEPGEAEALIGSRGSGGGADANVSAPAESNMPSKGTDSEVDDGATAIVQRTEWACSAVHDTSPLEKSRWTDSSTMDEERFSDYHSDFTDTEELSVDQAMAPQQSPGPVQPAAEPDDLLPDYADATSVGDTTSFVSAQAFQEGSDMTTERSRDGQASGLRRPGNESSEDKASHTKKLLALFAPVPAQGSNGSHEAAQARPWPALQGVGTGADGISTKAPTSLDDLKELLPFYAPTQDAGACASGCTTEAHGVADQVVAERKARLTFLTLPREIRDMIYDKAFGSMLVLMDEMCAYRKYMVAHFPSASSNATDSGGISPQVFPCLERDSVDPACPLEYGRRPGLPERVFGQALTCKNVPFTRKHSTKGISARPMNTGLLFTCRQLSAEFAENIQSRLIVAFSSQRRMLQYLGISSSERERKRQDRADDASSGCGNSLARQLAVDRKHTLKNLCLEIKRYGEPEHMDLRPQRFKYYENWRRACEGLARELPELQHVAVLVHVPKSVEHKPTQLNLEARWARPLAEFGRRGTLRTASVTLLIEYHHHGATLDTGAAFSEVLRRKMLGQTDAEALEALGEFKARQAQSHAPIRTQHNAWVTVERSNGLEANGILGKEQDGQDQDEGEQGEKHGNET